jgi:hypothetical protein
MRFGIFILLAVLTSSCTFVQERYPYVPPGPYRAVLKLENNPILPNPKGKPLPEKMNLEFDEVTDGELPFTFEVEYESDTTLSTVKSEFGYRVKTLVTAGTLLRAAIRSGSISRFTTLTFRPTTRLASLREFT